ncbi:MAG: acyl-CoA dehydrogenase family protein, partial [Anaerotruncus sp.]|nr:acyl-CoA dehydrogenase family protein [Anaerotruncus sp.]
MKFEILSYGILLNFCASFETNHFLPDIPGKDKLVGGTRMDFVLSKEQEMARQLFRDFAEKEVKPLAQEVDE